MSKINSCSLLRVDRLLIVEALENFLRSDKSDLAINDFIKNLIDPSIKRDRRVKMNELDTLDDIERFVKNFLIAFNEKIDGKLKIGESVATLSKLSKAVYDRLMVEADKHLTLKLSQNDDSDEDKTTEEVKDRYRAKTEEHLKEFYGAGSTINSIKTYFKDQIITAAFWDMSGPIVARNNEILNERIEEFKNKQYRYIVEFLQSKGLLDEHAHKFLTDEDGNFIDFEYYETLEKFYEYFKTAKEEDPETRLLMTALDKVIKENQLKLNNSQRRLKESLYSLLISSIQSDKPLGYKKTDEGFTLSNKEIADKLKAVNDKVKKMWSVNAAKRSKFELYTTGRLSNYYNVYKKLLLENGLGNVLIVIKSESIDTLTGKKVPAKVKTISEIFETIEAESTGILPATRAYTILTHFDSLLGESTEKIEFPKSLEGVVTVGKIKYKHHQDTAHQKKSWQTSEDMSSERSTADLTKAVFNRISIYDYRTDQSSDKRVDATKFIVASHNLLDDIIFRRIEFRGEDAEVKDPNAASVNRFAREFREAVADLHKNPVRNFLKMLQLLFDNGEFNLIDVISFRNTTNKRLLTTTDINVLYSVYNALFNKNNPISLISAELTNAKTSSNEALSLVGEIAGYVDRNASVHYMETSVDLETGRIKIAVKRKFSNRIPLKKTIDKINQVNRRSKQEARELSLMCKLEYPTDNASGSYKVTLGTDNAFTYEVVAPSIGLRILNQGVSVASESREQLKKLEQIDLIEFRNKEMNNLPLDADEKQLHNLLTFIEKALGINIITNPGFNLQILQIFKDIYNPGNDTTGLQGIPARSQGYSGALEPLLMMAVRAAYANERRVEMFNLNESRVRSGQEPLTLKEYLSQLESEDNDGIYDTFTFNRESTAFRERFDEVSYRIASFQDEFLSDWEDARAMLTGEASRATTKDKEGNSIPNNSVNKLGNILPHYLRKLKKDPKSQVTDLMFVNNPELLLTMYHDLEVTAQNGESKIIKSFSSGELFFHSIFNKFWGNYLNKQSVVIQPTVYSDKTTFLNWEVSTKFLNVGTSDEGSNDILSLAYDNPELYQAAVIQKYGDTIGEMYRKIWENTEAKLIRIAARYNQEQKKTTGTDPGLGYVDVLNRLTEPQLIALATRANETLELDKDYRVVKSDKGLYCTYNEMLKYNAEHLYATDEEEKYSNLKKFLDNQKKVFVANLLNSNTSFQVIDYNDKYTNYLDAKVKGNSRNVIVKTILDYYGKNNAEARKKFFENWVDAKTGKLIIAKTADDKNIIGVGDNYNGEAVELNPFLDKFFYVEGLLSNNLRMSLTGSEINHPDKAKKTLYNEIKKNKNIKSEASRKELAKELDIPAISESTAEAIKEYLDGTRTIHDVDLDNVAINIKPFIEKIYDKSMESIVNTAQGTQFKRNVIIPATLQYCRQMAFDGVPEKIRCAVIRDVKAPVYNYRGDKEGSIDAADGSARITPFQSILENKSLDSQAVGFIKKPIWHAYDSESGTSFLAKFATDTITNEEMRAASGTTDSLFNLFKKMTNIQWEEPIDLTTTVGLPKDATEFQREEWFKTKILGNVKVNGEVRDTQRLFYKNAYGEVVRIFSLKKNTTEKKDVNDTDIYYTEELAADQETEFFDEEGNKKKVKYNKVYHLFYDQVDENGKVIKKSVHKTFDTYQKARAFLNDGNNINVHTINSLFELHTALGGITCVDSKGNDSEFVNEVVVNYMNNICKFRTDGPDTKMRDQETFEQPLKKYHIGYALNNTAVKNGAKNINESSAWSDNSELKWFEVDSDGLGMQMNADHDIINSELTEFSQVITATSAYGFTFDNCDETFTSLGMAAFQASYQALTAVNSLLETTFKTPQERTAALSQLYDAVGRIIMTNQSIKDKESLLNIIMGAVQKVFFTSKNHLDDVEKIPFSDANIYSEFISTLASTINKESIKRKHPGSGSVLVPGYNTMMYYEIGGNKMMATDVLNAARKEYRQELENVLKTGDYGYDEDSNSVTFGEEGKEVVQVLDALSLRELENFFKENKIPIVSKYYNDIEDTTDKNNAMIKAYLDGKQQEVTIMDNSSWFMPSDIVDIMDSTNVARTIDLNSLDTYYDFKFGVYDAEYLYNVTIKSDYKKGSFEIFINDDKGKPLQVKGPDGQMYRQSFKLEPELEDGEFTGKYNIHFRTGYFNPLTERREVIESAVMPDDWKERLFKAALRIMPVGKTLRLSPTTAKQIETGLGGLTAGSIAGYKSIGSNASRVDGTTIVPGESYTVRYFDVKSETYVPVEVTEYTKTAQENTLKYRENIIKPHNLRPSIIRWQEDDGNGNLIYKNIFDTAPIREAYVSPAGKPKGYRKNIQNLLHELEQGRYTDENDVTKEVHNLENYAAELIMSNIYQDKFGIGNESLYDILSQGEDYFIKKEGKTLKAPATPKYDIAFISDTGKSTLITLGNVYDDNRTVYKVDFNANELSTNDDDEIYYMSHNKPQYKVGRWIDEDTVLYNKENNTFTRNGEVINSKDYRIKGDRVLKRIMYVERYNLLTTASRDDTEHFVRHTLFKLANLSDFKRALEPVKKADEELDVSAKKQRASIIRHIFGNSKAVYVNTTKNWVQYGKKNPIEVLDDALDFIKQDKYISQGVKDLLDVQLNQIRNTVRPPLTKNATPELIATENTILKELRRENRKAWRAAQEKFLAAEAHKKWVSFLDSVNFIASRIPAQTLLSFMAMKLVAWTLNSKNMAYVSHFQTYLQGSDYDIDKAYIMGQSYDEQATYIGWSNLFDYTSVKTLQASKTLPIPKGDIWAQEAKSRLKEEGLDPVKNKVEYRRRYDNLTKPRVDSSNHDTTIDAYLELQNKGLENLTEDERVLRIKYLAKIIRNMEKSNRTLYYQGQDTAGIKELVNIIKEHEFTPIHPEVSEAAYKNVASANIYAVSHDIRNRDQAYTAITVATLHDAAEDSPKGKQASSLNMLNPLTKYVMQYQNLVGKNVISIAANGEKVWFSAYYYWHKVLESGNQDDINRLKFSQKFSRILGRAKGTPYEKVVNHLPDLDIRNEKIRTALEKEFGVDPDSEEYVYVDQLISQLLSAATDNAKELILDKINAGMNFARMYVYAIVSGYDINDIVAFMTSPAASFIDKMSAANIFQNDSVYNSANSAISLSRGYINAKKYLHGSITNKDIQEFDTEGTARASLSKTSYVLDRIKSKIKDLDAETVNAIKEYLEIAPEDKFTDLSDTVRGLINILIEKDIDFDFTKVTSNDDTEINTYLAYCQDLFKNLRSIYQEYRKDTDVNMARATKEARQDIEEFEKLYNLSTEMSLIATSYLSLNQGLPTSELDIIKRLTAMTKIVQNRESALRIRSYELFTPDGEVVLNKDDDDFWETSYQLKKSNKSSKKNKAENLEKLVDRILENNPTLNRSISAREDIKERLRNAYKNGIMNNFNATKYVIDKEYRKQVKDYYGLIMGTLNVFDIMDKIPTYQRNLDCLRLLITSNGLSAKSRFINKLIYKKSNITDKELPSVIRYANQLIAYNFAAQQAPILLQLDFEGLDEYFLPENTNVLRMDSLNGIATFRKWVETDFFNDIRNRFSRNGAIKHLTKLIVDDQETLAMDIDMLSPNTSTESALAYDEILRGMAELDLSTTKYMDTDYTISDILQLYNIIVHNNQYGSERLTTAFKACSNPNSIMKKYFDYISRIDLLEEDVDNYILGDLSKDEVGGLNYDTIDYYIAIAPIISKYSESVHNEPFVKVKDDMYGFILKRLNSLNNYEEYPLVSGVPTSSEHSMEARKNFALYSPMLFVNSHSVNTKVKFLDFESIFNVNSLDELLKLDEENGTTLVDELKQDLLNVLSQFSISSKLWVFKKC